MTKPFQLTEKQKEAQQYLAGPATHVMLEGGGRSGKTFLNCRAIAMRALKAPGSRHLIARYRFNHVIQAIVHDTWPKVMSLAFPGVPWTLNKTHWYATLGEGSEIWFGGLDDKERMEKILGNEYATIYPNECSQLGWAHQQMLVTRLAQLAEQKLEGRETKPLKLRMLYDCNPPSKAHWTYKVFHQKRDPDTGEPLRNPENYVRFLINPYDNRANLSPEYLQTLDGMGERMKRRFVHGLYADATPNALFDESVIDRWRSIDGETPALQRVIVSVDPSGASDDEANIENDEIGIVVDALGTDGRVYLLEDLTVKGGPSTWGRIAVEAFVRHKADAIVGETNFGGGMVKFVVQTAAAKAGVRVPFKMVTASRGKVQRAEPFSALYDDGKVRHVGLFPKLEDEMCAFSTAGYTGPKSPNRADAHIWALAELFPAVVAQETTPKVEDIPMVSPYARSR